jgi:hypothetical protein
MSEPGRQLEWDKLFATLELTPDATRDEVKQAWRDLAKIWHPDRFASDPRLAAKCQEKLKKINDAFHHLDAAMEQGIAFGHLKNMRPAAEPATAIITCRRCGRPISENAALCDTCMDGLENLYAQSQQPDLGRRRDTFWLAYLAPAGAILLCLLVLAFVNWTVALWVLILLMTITTIWLAVRFLRR